MTTYYWIPTNEEWENLRLETYGATQHAMADQIEAIFKKPNLHTISSDLPHVIEEQAKYYRTSNREDLLVLKKEKQAFDAYYEKELFEIRKALNFVT